MKRMSLALWVQPIKKKRYNEKKPIFFEAINNVCI
jgi:hypothetical protein